MGEANRKRTLQAPSQPVASIIQTPAGRVLVCWSTESAATPMGQLVYFIEFLTLSGLWSAWQDD